MRYIEYREHRIHGTKDFPFAYYYVTPEHPRYHMQYHWHHEYELIHIHKGILNLNVNNHEYILNQGDSAFIESGALHGGTPAECTYSCIVFDLENFLSDKPWAYDIYTKLTSTDFHFNPFLSSHMFEIKSCIENMCNSLSSKDDGTRLSTVGSLYLLLDSLLKEHCFSNHSLATKMQQKKMTQIKTVLSYISKNYCEDLTLNDIASQVNMNPNYFCRAFREAMHKTPMEYLNYYRIESACEQLATTDLSITEIAIGCGFFDSGYFVKVFKKYKGVVPSRYRLD